MLAALPPGDVEGLLRLDGPPALAFGGTGEGGGGGSGGVDRGPERVARLSEAALANLQLPRPCEARRVLFRLLRAHWKVGDGYSTPHDPRLGALYPSNVHAP